MTSLYGIGRLMGMDFIRRGEDECLHGRFLSVAGALQGMQNRVLVISHIPALGFQRALIAIMTDTASLSLPSGVEGLAGLRFLRHFARWGAELTTDGGWRFFLSNGKL